LRESDEKRISTLLQEKEVRRDWGGGSGTHGEGLKIEWLEKGRV